MPEREITLGGVPVLSVLLERRGEVRKIGTGGCRETDRHIDRLERSERRRQGAI